MIEIENTDVYGWETAIRGMRNPLNSWGKSDSGIVFADGYDERGEEVNQSYFRVGEKDLDLMRRLVKSGTDHAKFMRMIMVSMDVTAPLYWWKEFDTYKVGTVANSCSTMHTIHKKEFTLDDFSHEHLELLSAGIGKSYYDFTNPLIETIAYLNIARKQYLDTKNKDYWWQMIQLLPSSYNQKRTIMLNYQVLQNMYRSRKNHKLGEWHTFCDWIESLPYSELITGKETE